jgi:hypothetical protein
MAPTDERHDGNGHRSLANGVDRDRRHGNAAGEDASGGNGDVVIESGDAKKEKVAAAVGSGPANGRTYGVKTFRSHLSPFR